MSKTGCLPDNIDSIQGVVCFGLGQLAHPFNSPDLIRELLNGIREVTGSARVDLLLYQSDMNILFFAETASASKGSETGLSLADTKNSAPVEALVGGHTVYVGDVRNSAFTSLTQGSRSLLAVPVLFGERVHGVLNAEHSLADVYDDETVRWIEAVSSILAVLLEQSYLTEQLFKLNQKLIDQMTESATEQDPAYRDHAERVSATAASIAEAMNLPPEVVGAVRDSGYLHDIGKSGVSQSILVKPGQLDGAEVNEVRRHPVLGRFLLKPLGFQPAVIEGVVSHHERWDGEGYPRGLAGNQIPIAGRILAVAEAWDVMTWDQPYRAKMSKEDAIGEMKSQTGKQFDPSVVKALLKVEGIG